MLFTSSVYYIFLLSAFLLFSAARSNNYKKILLAIASAVFCISFSWLSFFVLIFSGIINYFLLSKLHQATDKKVKTRIYYGGVAFNILILVSYKLLQVLLPKNTQDIGFIHEYLVLLGVGFYVLQAIGYFFEVCKKKTPFSLSPLEFYLSLAFFAKLPAGPILQMKQVPEIITGYGTSEWKANLSYAIQRILLGLFKKIALADRLGYYVGLVFDDHSYINGLSIYLSPILFTLQLYFDFSGLIDIAIGSARLFGIRLPENFNYPLRATSVTEFWRRWHMSLINWLTQYIFYPLSFRLRKLRQKGLAVAVIITFLISAAWHGLAVTFFAWALCHIIYIVIEHWVFKGGRNSGPVPALIRVFIVLHLVAFANLFFRAESLDDAARLITDFSNLPFLYPDGSSFKSWLINGSQDIEAEFNFRLSLLLCILFLIFERRIYRYATSEKYRIGYVAAMVIMIVVFGFFHSGKNFIYASF